MAQYGPFLTRRQRIRNWIGAWFGVEPIKPQSWIEFMKEAERRKKTDWAGIIQAMCDESKQWDSIPWKQIPGTGDSSLGGG